MSTLAFISPNGIIWVIISVEILWLIVLLALFVWLWTKVHDHLKVTLTSDVTEIDITKVANFSGLVSDMVDTPAAVGGKIHVLDPTGAPATDLDFASGEDGTYSVPWTAVLPAGPWTFQADVQGVLSEVVTVTLSAA